MLKIIGFIKLDVQVLDRTGSSTYNLTPNLNLCPTFLVHLLISKFFFWKIDIIYLVIFILPSIIIYTKLWIVSQKYTFGVLPDLGTSDDPNFLRMITNCDYGTLFAPRLKRIYNILV